LALNLPVDRFLGVDTNGGANMVKLVAEVPEAKAEVTLGFSSSEETDKMRTSLRVLAYQHVGQRVGFFWDSDPSAFDRRAIRDGHYFLWIPSHVFAHSSGGEIVGINPDLGNLYWHYQVPEATNEEAIVALAPKTKYWHCKQLQRVLIPDLERTYFLLVPLPDGEIDYRFAVAAMLDAKYDGWLAIEGYRYGDQILGDGRSVAYVKGLLAELGQ